MPQLSQDRNLPKAITNVRLSSALQNCGGVTVADAFDKSGAGVLYVYDDRTMGYTEWTDQEPAFASKCFKAKNPGGSEFVLLPLDGRIITGASIIKGGVKRKLGRFFNTVGFSVSENPPDLLQAGD